MLLTARKTNEIKHLVRTIPLLATFLTFSLSSGATIYQWADREEVLNFTDDFEKIPSAYHNQVHLRVVEDAPVKEPSPTPGGTSPKGETKKDIFGLGEEWWGDRVQPWKGKLKEASEHYKIKDGELTEGSKTLIARKFGSHQQFKSAILGMDGMRKERARYEARLIEAREALNRILKDAEESGADPEWVTGRSKPGQSAFQKAEVITTEAYGRGEAWWRGEVFTRREQLKEAVGNYEKAFEKYSKSIEELGPWRFGGLSLTQYQMISCRLDDLNREVARYDAQVAEAGESLNRLLKEAEEFNINPDWINQ